MKKQKQFLKIVKMSTLVVLFALYVVPLLFVLLNSFKSTTEIIAKPLALPTNFSFTNYFIAFDKMNYLHGFLIH